MNTVNWLTLRAEAKRMVIEAVQDGTAYANSRERFMVALMLNRCNLLARDEHRIGLAWWLPTEDARKLVNDNNGKIERIG